jgi:hypothetical protein
LIGRLINSETVDSDYYAAIDLLQDLQKAMFSRSDVDIYKRNLQRAYVDRLEYLMITDPSRSDYNVAQSDVRALVRGELNSLQYTLRSKRNATTNKLDRYHYEDLLARVANVLNPR